MKIKVKKMLAMILALAMALAVAGCTPDNGPQAGSQARPPPMAANPLKRDWWWPPTILLWIPRFGRCMRRV